MVFDPNEPLTPSQIAELNAACKALGSTTTNNFKLALETDSRQSDVARWFRTGSSSRNIVTRDFAGKTINDVCKRGTRIDSIRLMVAVAVLGGVTGNAEKNEFSKTEKLDLGSVTDAAIVMRSYIVGGTKTFFMKHRASSTEVQIVDGKAVLLTSYNPLAPGEYRTGMFAEPVEDEPEDDLGEDEEEEEWDE